MDGEHGLGEILIEAYLMTEEQLKTALDFQNTLGGDLRSIVVKLGYVKDSVLASLVAQEEHVETASAEITADVIDFDAIKLLPKAVLEKHQVIPLRSVGTTHLVLAMSDPNDLNAIEEIQFLVNRTVEPAVTTKHAIRKALNHLEDLKLQYDESDHEPPAAKSADWRKAMREIPVDRLIRAYLALQIEKGKLSADELLALANKL